MTTSETGPARRLRAAVSRSTPRLLALSAADSARRPAPGQWSPREVLGHLIDSASHNHQRFVRALLQDELVFQGYAQETWVAVQRYQSAPWEELVHLWQAFNRHLARVMEAAPREARQRARRVHNLHEIAWQQVPEDEPTTLDDFFHDYVDHLEHHVRQILGPEDATAEEHR